MRRSKKGLRNGTIEGSLAGNQFEYIDFNQADEESLYFDDV